MKRILTVVAALALVGYLGGGANAAEMVKQGAERLAITGSADYATTYGATDGTGMSLTASGEYGYMVLDQLELALRGTFTLTQTQVSNGYGDGGNYNIRSQNYGIDFVPKWRPALEGNISPFIGPKVGVRYITNSMPDYGYTNDTVFEWGAVLGADIFLGKNVALVVEYDYTQYTLNSNKNTGGIGTPIPQLGASYWQLYSGQITVRDHALTAGLAYWW
jgi:opacity protein-like surface antigen